MPLSFLRSANAPPPNALIRMPREADGLLFFVRTLGDGYLRLSRGGRGVHDPDALRAQLPPLWLAEAALSRALLPEATATPHIAVLGPTQSGKSSVVNLLLGADLAQASPLAGHTVHPQGFAIGAMPDLAGLDAHFAPLVRRPAQALRRDEPDAYVCTVVAVAAGQLPACVLWDTPDFDSVAATTHLPGVLKVAALADLVLLAVSAEKYADESVWDLLRLLEPLGQPMLICLNKVESGNEELLRRSFLEQWHRQRADAQPAVLILPYSEDGRPPAALATRLRDALSAALRGPSHPPRLAAARLIRHHWNAWLAPVRAELRAAERWRQIVSRATDEGLALYQREFLEHPRHYDSFQRALAELLTLLEIPGLAWPMSRLRLAVTWPVRQLARMLGSSGGRQPPPPEQRVLDRATRHLLTRAVDEAFGQTDLPDAPADWWRELALLARAANAELEAAFHAASTRYREAFLGSIEETAGRLYQQLQSHPALLNTLRATRAGADATALALVLKTGGIGIHDFILTPAVISVTSLLAESALGGYLQRLESDLKRAQHEAVRRQVFQGEAFELLAGLPQRLKPEGKLRIAEPQLRRAEELLDAIGR